MSNTMIPPANNNDESRIPTIPCPAADPSHQTMPCPANNILRQNKTVLANEILKLKQDLARASRQKEPLEKRMSIWANLTICKSLLCGLQCQK
jgi:hypothetical protein